ncbi:helix-turn-helix domain-containing protein [Kitasatospora sp. NBC_01539]|uniref:helix-turn-helix domain-containing protein n=1 Tax=Kitasatospora sp. NBC_01539 TaxID=2903577 RepID=UPI00386014C6
MFAALGLDPAEEEVYRLLATRVDRSVAGLAADTGRTTDDVRGLLAALTARGLATGTPGPGGPDADTVYTAAPPDVALGAVLRQRRDDLHAVEAALADLAEQHHRAARDRASGVVEVITDVAAVRHRFAQLQQSAHHHVRSMMVPNLTVVPHTQNEAGQAGVRRGVLYRAILQRSALVEPGMVAGVLASLAEGQQLHVADHVPVKLVIADSRVAMVPLRSAQNTAAASVLVHAGGLLDALIAYFETSWQASFPISANTVGDGLTESRPGEIDELDSRILALVLAGLTDQAAAGQLGISRRTVQRRLTDLMARAGVETRIQLGWQAARRGWA